MAAGLVPFALGSETSGSILTPAAYCGVTGLRPTYGLVSRYGAMALSWTLDKIGVLGRSATALQLLQDAMAEALPRGVSRIPGLIFQRLIGVIERTRRDPAPVDAAIYVIVARRVAR